MRSLRILLLFATSVIAENPNYYGQTQQDSRYPMDYVNDSFNQDFKLKPDSTFSFNFEQTRRDQPTQIEMRKENVGRYIYARPQTSTPASLFSMKADRESQHVYPNMNSLDNYRQQQGHWNQQHVPAVPPPPKFAFSSSQNNPYPRNTAPNWNVPTVHQNNRPTNHHHIPSVPNLPTHPVQWTQPPKAQSTPAPYFSTTSPKRIDGIQFSPSASYVTDSISKKNFHSPNQAPSLPSRGSHKFNWNDVKNNEAIKSIANNHQANFPQMSITDKPSTPKSIHNKPPLPVPTLSPWYDNFGK